MAIYAPQTAQARFRRARVRRFLVVTALIVAAAVFGPQAFASNGEGDPAALSTYTVGSGETLWSIASSMTPVGDDVRETMAQIQRLNAMTGSQVMTGDQLVVPTQQG